MTTEISPQPQIDEQQESHAALTHKPSGWDMLLAILPHILILFYSANQFVGQVYLYGIRSPVYLLIVGLISLAYLAFFLYAWKSHWPLWSATWYGYWILSGFIIISNMALWLLPKRYWGLIEIIIAMMLLGLVMGYFWLMRKNQMRGFLAILFILLISTASILNPSYHYHFIASVLSYVIICLLVCLATFAILILQNASYSSSIIIMLNFLLAFVYASLQAIRFFSRYPFSFGSFVGRFIMFLTGFFLLSSIIIFLPQAFWALWDFAKEKIAPLLSKS